MSDRILRVFSVSCCTGSTSIPRKKFTTTTTGIRYTIPTGGYDYGGDVFLCSIKTLCVYCFLFLPLGLKTIIWTPLLWWVRAPCGVFTHVDKHPPPEVKSRQVVAHSVDEHPDPNFPLPSAFTRALDHFIIYILFIFIFILKTLLVSGHHYLKEILLIFIALLLCTVYLSFLPIILNLSAPQS